MWLRKADLLGGKPTPFDALVFVIWACLLLAPVFTEVNMLGVKLKQQVEAVKAQVANVDKQVEGLRAEFHNSVDIRSQVNPSFTITSTPHDSELRSLEKVIRTIIEEAVKQLGVNRQSPPISEIELPSGITFLLSTRYRIEREIRRLWREQFGKEADRLSAPRLIPSLVEARVLPSSLGDAIRGIHSVCSPATHGEDVSDAKINFVRDLAPELLSTLRAIKISTNESEAQHSGNLVREQAFVTDVASKTG